MAINIKVKTPGADQTKKQVADIIKLLKVFKGEAGKIPHIATAMRVLKNPWTAIAAAIGIATKKVTDYIKKVDELHAASRKIELGNELVLERARAHQEAAVGATKHAESIEKLRWEYESQESKAEESLTKLREEAKLRIDLAELQAKVAVKEAEDSKKGLALLMEKLRIETELRALKAKEEAAVTEAEINATMGAQEDAEYRRKIYAQQLPARRSDVEMEAGKNAGAKTSAADAKKRLDMAIERQAKAESKLAGTSEIFGPDSPIRVAREKELKEATEEYTEAFKQSTDVEKLNADSTEKLRKAREELARIEAEDLAAEKVILDSNRKLRSLSRQAQVDRTRSVSAREAHGRLDAFSVKAAVGQQADKEAADWNTWQQQQRQHAEKVAQARIQGRPPPEAPTMPASLVGESTAAPSARTAMPYPAEESLEAKLARAEQVNAKLLEAFGRVEESNGALKDAIKNRLLASERDISELSKQLESRRGDR